MKFLKKPFEKHPNTLIKRSYPKMISISSLMAPIVWSLRLQIKEVMKYKLWSTISYVRPFKRYIIKDSVSNFF